jgi:hypothetical protein
MFILPPRQYGELLMTDRASADNMESAAMTADSSGFVYRLKFEDTDLDALLGDWDVYTSRVEAMAEFDAAIADPPIGAGSVYVTEDDGEDEVVIANHYFDNVD